jgi:NitT/TauT family transport system ATP-binding protein
MDKDPGRVVTEMSVGLRHPRQRKDTAFQALTDKVYAAVAGKTETEVFAAGGRKQKLPAAHLNALAGLVEKVAAERGRCDLYVLHSDLVMELDDLLPVVEAGEILGFLVVQEGDLELTPLGHAYAEASILARKELVAGRILRLPIIAWIYETLQQDDNQRVAKEYFVDKLQPDFADRAEKQLMIAVQWGRFAEIFGYDDDTDELFLESEESPGISPGGPP